MPPMTVSSTVDLQTLTYYAQDAGAIAGRYEQVPSSVARFFSESFQPGARVLDVGAGSGRDLTALLDAGFQGYGVEPVAAMREQALTYHPKLAGRLSEGMLPALGMPFGGVFDGVLCSAVLMHVPRAMLAEAARAISDVLRPGGRLLLSLPLARPDVDSHHRDLHGRLFEACDPQYISGVLHQAGFRLLERWDTSDALGRPGTSWYTLLMELAGEEG